MTVLQAEKIETNSTKLPDQTEAVNWRLEGTIILALLAICGALFFFRLACWGFIDPGDGYFSEAAREMMERGDYVVPHLNYQIYFSKPVLIYWLIISAYKTFGVTEFAARFWSAALATAMAVTAYWSGRSIVNKRTGIMAAVLFAASPLVVTFARMSLIDMSFSALLGIALCATAMTLFTNSKRWWPIIYTALGLAVLDKGPAGLILYAIGVAAYVLLCSRQLQQIKDNMARLHVLPGAIIFSVIALPWYFAVGAATHGLWPKVFFLFENFGRFAGHTNHKQPSPLFYLPVLAYGFFPWVAFLPAACADLFGKVATVFKGRLHFGALDKKQLASLLFASWTLGVLVFFSASMTKLQTYILPAFPGMALWVACVLNELLERDSDKASSKSAQLGAILLGVVGTVLALGSVAASVVFANPSVLSAVHSKYMPLLQAAISDTAGWMLVAAPLTGLFVSVALCAAAVQLLKKRTAYGIGCAASAAIVGCTILGPIAFELGYKYRDGDVHAVIGAIKDKSGPVAIYHDFKPSVVYHLQRPVDTFFSADQLLPSDGKQTQYIIVGAKGRQELLQQFGDKLTLLAQKGDWSVFSSTHLIALRLPTLEQSHRDHIDLSGGEYGWGMLPFAGGTK